MVFKIDIADIKMKADRVMRADQLEREKDFGQGELNQEIPQKYGLWFPLDSLEEVGKFIRVLKQPPERRQSEGGQVELVSPKDELVRKFQSNATTSNMLSNSYTALYLIVIVFPCIK